jgi:cell division septal protein FtsQ
VRVTAPADRRFLRAQVKPGRRRTPWLAWLRAARVVLVVAVLGAAVALLVGRAVQSPSLRVGSIVVKGTERLSPGDVLALLEGLRGQNILFVRLEEWRGRVATCPWVASVTIRRSMPSTIEVAVTERRPMAIGRVGEDLFLVDERGGVIDEYGPSYADLDLPIVDGLGAAGRSDAAVNERRAQLAARVLRAVRSRPDLSRRISQLDVSDPRNAVVIVDHDPARVRLGEDRFVERLQSYLELASNIRAQVPAVDYVDLRYGERVFVGAQGSPPAAAGQARRPGPASNH